MKEIPLKNSIGCLGTLQLSNVQPVQVQAPGIGKKVLNIFQGEILTRTPPLSKWSSERNHVRFFYDKKC